VTCCCHNIHTYDSLRAEFLEFKRNHSRAWNSGTSEKVWDSVWKDYYEPKIGKAKDTFAAGDFIPGWRISKIDGDMITLARVRT
jgi:hypothetical protein